MPNNNIDRWIIEKKGNENFLIPTGLLVTLAAHGDTETIKQILSDVKAILCNPFAVYQATDAAGKEYRYYYGTPYPTLSVSGKAQKFVFRVSCVRERNNRSHFFAFEWDRVPVRRAAMCPPGYQLMKI